MKLLFIILGTFMALSSQSQTIVSGNVKDMKGQAIVFANILLLDKDSTYLTGSVSNDNGQFQLPLSANAALLKISYIGYQDQVRPIQAGHTEIGTIVLQEDAKLLDEVVVKGNFPKTHIKGDAMVTSVAGSLLEKAGTALDVLSKVPGLTLKGQDINVFGRGAPQVYINGREVRDPSELNQLTSDNIRSVEVVSNPGARYDKTVKAVIRIQTKKPADDGFGFADRANASYNDKWSYFDQLDLYYRRGKLDLTGMLFYSDQNTHRRVNATQLTYLDHFWEQRMQTAQTFISRQLATRLTFNYAINPEHSVGMNYRFRRDPKSTNDMSLLTDIYRDNSFFEKSDGLVGNDSPGWRHEGNIYYTGKVGKWNIDFNGTGVFTAENSMTQTAEDIQNGQGENQLSAVHAKADTRNTFYAGKLNLSYPLWEGSLAFGGEYTHTSRSSLYQNEEGIIANDDSRIKEGLVAAYAEYERAFGKLKLQAGLRFENVGFDYYQTGIYQKEQSKDYNNLFPSLSVFMPFGEVQAQVSYNSEIARPGYQMLRNRIDYVNRYTYESGNPFLRPAITNTVALNVVYKWWQLYGDFQHLKDVFVPSSRPYSSEDPTIALMSSENAPAYNAMNIMLNASPTIGIWSPQFSLEMYKQWYKVGEPGSLDGTLSLNRPSFAARWKNGLELPWGVTLNADMNWEGRSDRSNISYKAVWWANASLYKEILNSQLTFLLQATDLFNSYRNNYFMYYGRLRTMNLDEKFSYRSIALTVQYKFNIKKSKYKGTGAGETQKNRL